MLLSLLFSLCFVVAVVVFVLFCCSFLFFSSFTLLYPFEMCLLLHGISSVSTQKISLTTGSFYTQGITLLVIYTQNGIPFLQPLTTFTLDLSWELRIPLFIIVNAIVVSFFHLFVNFSHLVFGNSSI